MRLGVDGEGVKVHVLGGHASVMLVGLDETEVGSITLGETVVAVELELAAVEGLVGVGGEGGVEDAGGVGDGAGVVLDAGDVTGELERVLALTTSNPDKLFNGVVKVEAMVVVLGGFGAGVLELLDEVLVGRLGETATLLGVEVDVVDEHAGSGLELGHDAIGGALGNEVLGVPELDVNLHLVVLESNEGKGEAGVTAEEELERDV